MTRKQMREKIRELEAESRLHFEKWGGALQSFHNSVEENEKIKAALKEMEADAEAWKLKYLEQLALNIRITEKIAIIKEE